MLAQLSEMRRRAERARAAQRDSARARSLDRSEGDPVDFNEWSRVGGPERSEMLSVELKMAVDSVKDTLGLRRWMLTLAWVLALVFEPNLVRLALLTRHGKMWT